MSEHLTLSDYVPHTGDMSLLDHIIDYGQGWLHASVLITEHSIFIEDQGVSATVGIEYLAQAVAAYSGSKPRALGEKPKLGFLLGIRRYESSIDYFPIGSRITLKVELEMEADNGLHVFQGRLIGNGFEASARLNVFQPADADEFLKGVL
ncbi:MAG: hypothetical protein CL578_19230 [Alteromonadaceae bacterium]|jgi:predicted hotdog family 3-hydroxylacyl-ACP dehydratase|uniref:3-hydroxylacyl-ACP dehydratase n=1 Tax=Paraglaciecola chathamensis TaxID=368405 RepID=A0ABS0WJ47_9ALTE|nr:MULTISPECIES: hypothetical protein [Paraglaciecola]MBJ2138500.1 hypothetical protein [Paraglaciecola chathamensis]MBN27157.1 hypothetical protein [Alteromonadaceae bacterium]|tara:strand:+ start:33274 stop:33723 length:450 start_codon:yes stop_codon:yes gene_type:complete